MIQETDMIMYVEDEIPNTYHVLSKKVGELGLIYVPDTYELFVFRQTDLNKYLKAWHIANILDKLNCLNR